MGVTARRLVAIGGSWGGLNAMRTILRDFELPADAAMVVVLHRQPVRSPLADVLGRGGRLPVMEVEDKAPITPGIVHLAPPDYHLLVDREWFSLSTDDPVKYSRPAIDVLLESAAGTFADRLVAVVLTGASDDGTDGAGAVRRHGGTVVVQDPATAEQPVMPKAVIDAGLADEIVALDDLPAAITKRLADWTTEGTNR